MSKLSEYARQKIEAEIGTPEESTYRANYKNGTLERALNGGALPEAPDDSSETWKAIKRFGNNILRGGEALIGGATAFLGANAASEPTAYDPYDPNTWYYHPAKEDINPAIGGKILDAGTWMLNDAAERNAKYGNVAYQGSIWDRLSNLDYWTDSRGLMADLGEGIGSMLPFVALTAATGGADLPLVGGLLGAAGRGAAGLAAREGALGLLGKAAQYGVRGLSSNAAANAMRYAAFSAPLTAISNAGGIYSDLAAQGYSNRDIAKTMRQMAWEEFPQDILTGSLDGLLLSGGIGHLLGGGGRAARLVKNLLGVPIGGAGEYFDELNQQIIQDKYTNQPYGTLLNPTPSEEAAAASAFFPGALFGLGGGAYDLVRGGKGSANASIADDPILSGALGTQIEETNAEIADAQKTALAQQLKNMLQGSKAASLNLPEQTERTGSTDDTSTGSTSGQPVKVTGGGSGAASSAQNAKERLWNAILPYAQKYNVDPRLVLAQLSHESANFDSDLARSANNYGGLTTTENTGMPQPDGNMQYARFSSPEDFVDHYFKWWGDTIKDSGSDVDAFTSKLKNEGYFGADLGSYTQAVKRHMSSLEKEGYTAAAEAKPVSGGAENAGTTENAGGVGYIASGSDAWDGFDGRYVGASSAFSQSNYDNMGKVHPETIAGVNALASEYFKRTGKKLLLNSLAGGSHPSNASQWGHAAGWKADIDNTGVDTKVFLDICEKLGIGAALEKDTHFDLSFGKGNAYMSTDQGTSDRTGSRWYEAYHSGKANKSAQSSQSETKRTPPIDLNKLFAGIGENSAFGRTFFDAFTRDVGDSTTNENLLVTLEKMKNVRGQFMNTKKNREALAAAFPQELQAYAMQLMQAAPEMTKTRQTAERAPRPMGRTQAEAAPRIEEAPMAKSVREVLQAEPPKAEAMDGERSLTRAMGTLEESTAPNEPQNTQQAPPSRAGGAESMPQGEHTQPAKGALQGEASAAESGRFQPAGRMQSPAAAMAELQTPGMQPDTHMQQELRLPAEGGHLQPSSKVTMQPAEQSVKRSAALEQRTRPEVQQQSGSVQQGAEMPPMDTVRQQREAAYRAQGAAESTQQAPTAEPAGMQTEPTARQEGQMPTVTPTAADIVLLDAMSPAANAKAGRRHQGRALMQLARKHAVKLPAGVIKLLGEGSSKKAIRAAQQALQAAGVRMPAKEERGHAEKAEQRRAVAAAMEEGTAKEHAKPSDEQLRQQETPKEVAAAEAKETKQRAETQKGKKAKGRLGKGLAELLQEDPGEQRKVLNRSLFRGRLSEKTLNESRGDAFRDVVEMSLAAQKAKNTSAETKTRGEETRAEEVKRGEEAERKEEMQEAAKERGEEAPNAQAEYAEARKSEPEEHEPELAKGYRTESGRSLAEADEREFILHPNGSEDFGEISQDISDAVKAQSGVTLQPGKIRLRVGNEKQGLIHANKHIAEAKRAGYDSIEDLVADVAQHFDRIYMRAPNNPSGKTVYSLIKTGNKQANIMNGVTPVYFELQKKGDENYYVVVTAIPKGDKSLARQTKKDRLIYSSPGLDAATAPGDSAVSHDGKAGTVNRGGSPTSDKSSDLSVTSVTQKAGERNGGKGDAVKYSAAMDDAEEAIKSAAKDTRAALDRLADAMGGKVTGGKRAFHAAKDKARFDRAARAFLYAADGNVQALDHVQGVRYSVAWHGSPHTFDTFKLRHIGSGEGAQAHGWGLYFAKGREVAEKYQKRLLQFLPPFRYIYDGKPLSSYKGQLGKILTYFSDRTFTKEELSEEVSFWAEQAEEELRRQEEKASMYDGVLSAYKKNPNISIEEMREIAMQDTTTDVSSYLLLKAISDAEYSDEGEPQTAKDVAETLKQQQKKVKRRITRHRREIKDLKSFDPEKLQYVENKGQLFKVDIPEENVLLDQQKPFNEQPEAVQKGINKIVEGLNDTQLNRWDNIREQGREAARSSVKESLHDADGQSIYLTLQRILGNAKNVSRALNKYGVKGITYQGWQDGHCYVVFDDQAIKVLEKFSAKGEGAKLRRMLQEATFLKDSELSTQEKKLSALGDAMGIPTVWMDADASLHGFHSDGVTFLNRRSKMHLPQVFWHEAFHYMRANNPKLYSEVVDYIQRSERFTPAQLENYRNKIARLGLSDADTIEEMLADQMHDVGMRVPLLKAMAKENPSLARRVASWIRRMIDRFVEHFRGAGDKLSERQTAAMARAFSAVMRDMKGSDGKLLFRVRGEYVENMDGSELPHLSADANKNKAADFYQSAGLQLPMEGRKFNDLFRSSIPTEEDLVNAQEGGKRKESAEAEPKAKGESTKGETADEKLEADSKAWKRTLAEAWKGNMPGSQMLKVMETPLALQLVGAKDLPMYIRQSKLMDIRGKHREMTEETFQKLPKYLADPMLVFKSTTKPGRIVAGLSLLDTSGINVVVPVELDAKKGRIEINVIASVYGRGQTQSDGRRKIQTSWFYNNIQEGNTLYINKKQAAAFYQSAGLQLPMEGRKFNDLFGSSIQTEEDLVKMREEHPGKYSAQGESPVKFSAALSDVGAPRRFFDSLARRFGRRAGLKADKIIVEERARNAKQDMGLSSYLLRSPSRVIKKYPIFLSFFRTGERAYDVLTERRSHFDKRMKEAFAPIKNKKDYADLREVLLAEDSAQKVYTRQELLDSGVKENVIDAHDRVRAMMAEAYEMVNEAHKRPTVKTANGLSDIRLDALKQNKFVRILREAQDADGKYSVTYREYANYKRTMTGVSEAALQRMEKDAAIQILKTTQAPDGSYTVKLREGKADLHNIKGYMPHFFHEYMIRVYDKNGKVTATLGSGRTEREAVKVAKDWLKENTLPKDAEIHIAPKMFNWAEAGMDESAFAAVVGDADYFKMRKKIAENTGKTLQEVEEMLDGAVRLKNRHRFFGNAMHRKGVEGYEKLNIGWVLGHYLSSACRYYALETEGKPKMINLYERIFGDFNKDPKTSLAKYTKDFINDLNGNPSWLEQATNDTLNKFKPWRQYIAARFGDRSALMLASSATGITTQLCLGFLNPSSALLNLTQVINAAAYIGDVSALMRCITRGLHRKYSAEDLRVLKETNVENDIGLDSGAGYDKRRSFGGIKSKLGSISMFPFKLTEGIVRRGTVLTAYKAGRKRGMSHDEAIVYAKDINRKANFDYSAVDAPNIFRRGSIYAQLLLQFKKYGFKEMEVVADMVPVAGDSELTVKQKLLFWTPFLLTGGLLGLPALDLLDWWLDDKFKLKLKKMVLEAGKDSPALDFAGKTALYGLPGSVLGIDVTSRAGLADVVPTSGRDLIGATLSKSTQFAKDFAEGNKAAMIRDFSPALYNYYTAMAGHSEGRRGRTNDTYDTAYDRLLRALGFRSMKESLSSDVSRITTMEKKEASTEKQKAIDDFLEDPSTENARRLQELGIKPQAVETERKKKKETRLERTAGSFSKKEQKAGRRKEIFDLAGEKEK